MNRCDFKLEIGTITFRCDRDAGHKGSCAAARSVNQPADVMIQWTPGPTFTVLPGGELKIALDPPL